MIKVKKEHEDFVKTFLFCIGIIVDTIILCPISLAVLQFIHSLIEKTITTKEND